MDHEILRGQIVAKLKKYEAYIDNELPDYIMVMLANKKSIQQINSDLQLFLGENTDTFTNWLEECILVEKQVPEAENVVEPAITKTTPTGSKRQRVDGNMVLEQKRDKRVTPSEGGNEENGVPLKVMKVRSDPDTIKKQAPKDMKLDENHGRDLRELIAERRGPRRPSASAMEEEEEQRGDRTNVSSVVRMVERPRGTSGTTRLLERAIKGISSSGGSGRSKNSSVKTLPDKPVGHKPRGERAAETKGRIEPEEQEPVEENFVDEFLAEQQTEDEDVKSSGVLVPVAAGKGPETSVPTAAHVLTEEEEQTPPSAPPPVDLRELLNRAKESGKDARPRFVVTMTGVNDNYSQLEPHADGTKEATAVERIEEETNEEEGVATGKGGGAQERCRFWPNCKNGDTCPYLHPTVPCRMFPSCKFGSRCHYVHPVCKFDARCTRSDCPYLHTAPKKKVLQSPKLPAVMPLFKPSTFKPIHHTFGGVPWQRRQKFPTKSDLTWTPNKPHISERHFSVSEEQTTQLSV